MITGKPGWRSSHQQPVGQNGLRYCTLPGRDAHTQIQPELGLHCRLGRQGAGLPRAVGEGAGWREHGLHTCPWPSPAQRRGVFPALAIPSVIPVSQQKVEFSQQLSPVNMAVASADNRIQVGGRHPWSEWCGASCSIRGPLLWEGLTVQASPPHAPRLEILLAAVSPGGWPGGVSLVLEQRRSRGGSGG